MANPDKQMWGVSISQSIWNTEKGSETPPAHPNPILASRERHVGERARINGRLIMLEPHYPLTKDSCLTQEGGPRTFLDENGKRTVIF